MAEGIASALEGATEKLSVVRDHVIVGVADAVNASVDVARMAKDKMGDGFDTLLDQGKDLADGTAELIRKRPWSTVGVAIAVGYVIAKLAGGRK